MKKIAVFLLGLVAAVSVAGNVLLYQRYSSRRPLMRVGPEVVTRKEYQDALDYHYGKAVLNKIAYEKMIRQAAARAGVTPTDKDVEALIADIDRRTPAVLEAGKSDPVKMAELKRDLKTNLALENLSIRHVRVTDAEVAAFYRRNRALFAVPAQAHTLIVMARNTVDAATAAALLRKNTPHDVIARQPRLAVVGVNGYNPDWRQLPSETTSRLFRTVINMKPGDVTTVPAGPVFLCIRVNKQSSAGVLPLARVRDRAVRYARLQKAGKAEATLARLYKEANVVFEVDRYAAFFSDIKALSDRASTKTASAR